MSAGIEIRRARPEEREKVLQAANESFSRPGRPFDFMKVRPYCFTAKRIPDHWVCLEEGNILGLIGVYPFTVRMAGIEFRSAGIGQVATLPLARGRGVMSSLLREITAAMDTQYDFTWLWGDRQRYGRYGWEKGGIAYGFETFDKYLPDPPPEKEVRPLDKSADFERIYDFAMRQPYCVMMERDEFQTLINTSDISGWAWRNAWVLCRPNDSSVLMADGDAETVAGLLSHLVRLEKRTEGDRWKVSFESGPYDSVITQVASRHFWQVKRSASASFRICDPAGYFSKAAAAVLPPPGGDDELSLRSTDTGREVRLRCRNGRYEVEPEAGTKAFELSPRELSEVAFGTLPLETALPGLSPQSPLRPLLRLPAYVSHLYAL